MEIVLFSMCIAFFCKYHLYITHLLIYNKLKISVESLLSLARFKIFQVDHVIVKPELRKEQLREEKQTKNTNENEMRTIPIHQQQQNPWAKLRCDCTTVVRGS